MEQDNNSGPETAAPENQAQSPAPAPADDAAPVRQSKPWSMLLGANLAAYLICAMLLSDWKHGPSDGKVMPSLFLALPAVVLLDVLALPFALFMPSLRQYRKKLAGCAVVAAILTALAFLLIYAASAID